MIQFNLLPEVKQEFIKARRLKRTVSTITAISAGTAIVILVLLIGIVNGAQKKYINDLSDDITMYNDRLQKTPDLAKILTIQNQLNSLTKLHDDKPVVSRLYDYLTAVTPALANIEELVVDFTANTLTMSGTADSLGTVNKFADTLKFTDYELTDEGTPGTGALSGRAFTGVVLKSYTRDATITEYELNTSFDPLIFRAYSTPTQKIGLKVPNIISTRSETEKPTALFNGQEDD